MVTQRKVTITTAASSHQDDVHARMIKYSVSMGIRLVCLLLALIAPGVWMWVFAAGAIVLPYVAVLLANAGRESPGRSTGERYGLAPPLQLTSADDREARPNAGGRPGHAEPRVIAGELVDEEPRGENDDREGDGAA